MSDKWRVGSRVPLNVYKGMRPICQCHNREDAEEIVATMNFYNDQYVDSKRLVCLKCHGRGAIIVDRGLLEKAAAVCSECGGAGSVKMEYEPKTGTWKCSRCGHTMDLRGKSQVHVCPLCHSSQVRQGARPNAR